MDESDVTKNAIQKTKVAIIGAGFGGLAIAIRLLQSQINDFVILEKTNDVVFPCLLNEHQHQCPHDAYLESNTLIRG